MTSDRRTFVYIAYLDESETKRRIEKWCVMSSVLVDDSNFKLLEASCQVVQDGLNMTPEQLDKFTEFHACELFKGVKFFEQFDEKLRLETFKKLVALPAFLGLPIVYGATDTRRLDEEVVGSADPLDISFRICVRNIEKFMKARIEQELRKNIWPPQAQQNEEIMAAVIDVNIKDLTLLIADDTEDRKVKETLHASFRKLRPRREVAQNIFCSFHDDMYFGDSRYSLGIQLADACSYVIARNLHGDDEIAPYFQLIEPQIVGSGIYPEPKEKPKLPAKTVAFNAENKAKQILVRLLEDEKKKRISSIQSSNDNHIASRSESSESGDGSGETGEREEAEG